LRKKDTLPIESAMAAAAAAAGLTICPGFHAMPVVAMTAISESGIGYQWFTDEGKERHEALLAWDEIATVEVFKRDLFTLDLVCLALARVGTEDVIEVDEEDPRWLDLVDALPSYLPGCRTLGEWFTDVAFPAFEENRRRLYERL
jgi:hypothetical protein